MGAKIFDFPNQIQIWAETLDQIWLTLDPAAQTNIEITSVSASKLLSYFAEHIPGRSFLG
jgi:hypothetical protein